MRENVPAAAAVAAAAVVGAFAGVVAAVVLAIVAVVVARAVVADRAEDTLAAEGRAYQVHLFADQAAYGLAA